MNKTAKHSGFLIMGIFLLGTCMRTPITSIPSIINEIAQGITSDLREETYAKIQSFSFGNIEKFSSGSLVVRLINDMNQVMNMMMILFMQLLRMPIILLGSFVLSIVCV
ncbi:MAG: ABC transporter transmembrane domain-containing protein [Prevotella melaninogenica]